MMNLQAKIYGKKILNTYPETIKKELRLNSAKVDLTSAIEKLN